MKTIILGLGLIGLVASACPELKIIGEKKQGFNTRYWDCCKPSCAWNHESRSCHPDGVTPDENPYITSICGGGTSSTCLSQIPFQIEGCDWSFAFVATPGQDGGNANCGKCFKFTYTGKGRWVNNKYNEALKGKVLIAMATNIGYDVEPGQFDLMVPGGGVGLFNGCDPLFGKNNMGVQYGGLLSECTQVDGRSDNDVCLREKCQKAFSGVPEALKACNWYVDWYEAADNPALEYEEIECPDVIKNKY